MNLIYLIITGFIISLASITGVVLVKSHKKIAIFVEKNLTKLSAFSAGIFFVTSFSLAHGTIDALAWKASLLTFFIGFVLFFGIQKIISTGHRHAGMKHTHKHTKDSALKVLIGDTIHNIADGLLLVASSGTSAVHGISTALSIFIHEVPQEISEFIVLKKSGYSTTEAAYKNFATALSIFVGIALGLIFINTEGLQAYLLGISASFFMGVIFVDLLPLKKILMESKWYKTIFVFILGIIVMKGILVSLPHEHTHVKNSIHSNEKHHEHSEFHH